MSDTDTVDTRIPVSDTVSKVGRCKRSVYSTSLPMVIFCASLVPSAPDADFLREGGERRGGRDGGGLGVGHVMPSVMRGEGGVAVGPYQVQDTLQSIL